MISLKLRNIRQFSKYKIDIDAKTTILVGENSSGKSTIIEAIYYCCFFRSFKTIHSKELIKFEHEDGYIDFKIDGTSIRVNFVNNKVSTMYNNQDMNKSEIVSKFQCILISPEQIEIVNRGPSVRRDFINRSMSQINKMFLKEQMKYNNLIKQKNKILKESSVDLKMYELLTKELNILDDNLVEQKIKYIKELEKSSNKIIKWITDSTEELTLNYKQVEVAPTQIKTREFKYKSSVTGNHLDDIEILLNGISLKKYGSQGQKRSVVISLVLGQMDLMYQKNNTYPIVLIDDIHAELDSRRQMLLSQLLSMKTKTIIAIPEPSMIVSSILNSTDVEVIDVSKKQV